MTEVSNLIINKKFCECGCGELIEIINKMGKQAKYKNHHHNYGKNHYKWKDGRIKDERGYIRILKPDHHFTNNLGYVYEHRLIWEEYYNCCLLPVGMIHHINGIKDDNRIENLQLMSRSDHGKHEAIEQWKTRKRFD
jgi:HNH endonuclease